MKAVLSVRACVRVLKSQSRRVVCVCRVLCGLLSTSQYSNRMGEWSASSVPAGLRLAVRCHAVRIASGLRRSGVTVLCGVWLFGYGL